MDDKTLQNQGNEVNDEDLSINAAIAALKTEDSDIKEEAVNSDYTEVDATTDNQTIDEIDEASESSEEIASVEKKPTKVVNAKENNVGNVLGGKKGLQRMSEELSFFVALQDNLTSEIDRLKALLGENDFDDLKKARVMDRVDTLMIACAELQYSTDLSDALLTQYSNRIKDLGQMLKKETNRELSDSLRKQISTLNTHAEGLADLLGEEWDEDLASIASVSTREQIQNMDEDEISAKKVKSSTSQPAESEYDEEEYEEEEPIEEKTESEEGSTRADDFENALQEIVNDESLSEDDIVARVEDLLVEYKDLRNDPDMKPMIDSIVENFDIDLAALDARSEADEAVEEAEEEPVEEEPDTMNERMRQFQAEFDRILSIEDDDKIAAGLEQLLKDYEDMSDIKAMQDVFAEIRDELDAYYKQRDNEPREKKSDKVDVAIMPNVSIDMDRAARAAEKIDEESGETADKKPVSTHSTTSGNVLFDLSRGDNFVTQDNVQKTSNNATKPVNDIDEVNERFEAFCDELAALTQNENDDELASDLQVFMKKYADLENDEQAAPIFTQIREELAEYEANKAAEKAAPVQDNSKPNVVVPISVNMGQAGNTSNAPSVASAPVETHEGKTAGSTVSGIDPAELARAMNEAKSAPATNKPVEAHEGKSEGSVVLELTLKN